MATLNYLPAKASGSSTAVQAAASVGGDKVAPNDRGIVLFRNGDASSKTVQLAVPGNTKYGQAQPDVTFTVPAGAVQPIGPLASDLADPSDGLIALTYPGGVTSCTVQAISI